MSENAEPDAEHVDELRDAERRVTSHPAAIEHRRCEALSATIETVFLPNWRELDALLHAASTDVDLAFELIQNVRRPDIRAAFRAGANRALHNYLASAMTLVDHTRRLMRNRTGTVAAEFTRRKADLLEHPEVPFMQDLRNFTLHRELPFLAHTLSMTNVNTPDQEFESEVLLSAIDLLDWDGWTARSVAFLSSDGDVELRPVVRKHGELVSALNIWLFNALMEDIDLTEVNELVVERNAILTGLDLDAARRWTDEWSSRRANPDPWGTADTPRG